MKSGLRTSLALAAAVGAGALLAGAGAAFAQTKVIIGSGLVPVHTAPIIFSDKRLAPNMGTKYAIEFVSLRGSPQQLTALASGELHLAGQSAAAFAAGIQNGGLDLVALADMVQDGPDFSSIYAVLESSGIASVKDLKGKLVGINARGGTQDMTVRGMLKRNGLEPDKDVRIVEIGFNAEAALRDGKVALASFSAGPWASATKKGGVKLLFRERDVGGDKQFIFYAARRDYVAKNRAVLVDVFTDYLHGLAWLHDPKNRPEMLKLVAAATKRPEASFADWAFLKGKDYFRDPRGAVNVKALQANLGDMKDFGLIKETFDVAKHADPSLMKEAAERLARK
jgi:ABC-type nitrate/sulfonate/bicarbonate transport system substrate-binding protein